MNARPAAGGNAGFTLIETLVALAIVGIVLTTVYAIFGNGLRAASRDEDRLLLALVAQNLLARSRFDLFPAEGALTGDIGGGLRWRIEGEPYPLPQDLLPEGPPAVTSDRDGGASAGGSRRESVGDRGDAGFGEAGGNREEGFGRSAGEFGAESRRSERTLGEEAEEARRAERDPVRLRLVRVTVRKGAERFELAGLVPEPRRGELDRLP